MLTDPPIEQGFIDDFERRRINAALAGLGLTQRSYSEEYDRSEGRVNRMINGKEIVTPGYAESFNELLIDGEDALSNMPAAA